MNSNYGIQSLKGIEDSEAFLDKTGTRLKIDTSLNDSDKILQKNLSLIIDNEEMVRKIKGFKEEKRTKT